MTLFFWLDFCFPDIRLIKKPPDSGFDFKKNSILTVS